MNTLQLKRALERDTFTKKVFGGVFAADELPKTFDTFPGGLVANTGNALGSILLFLT